MSLLFDFGLLILFEICVYLLLGFCIYLNILFYEFIFGSDTICIEYKKQDKWIGKYYSDNDTWICYFPMFPIHIKYKNKEKNNGSTRNKSR